MSKLEEALLNSLNNADPIEKGKIIKGLEELEIRTKEDLCKKYVPNVKSEEFIKMIGLNEVFINLFSAANGVGKTAVGANIIANICYGPQDFDGTGWEDWQKEFGKAPKSWFDYPLYKDFPYPRKGRIVSDPTTIKEQIVPELKKWFPSNRYSIVTGDDPKYITRKEGKLFEYKWVTDTGFEFDLMTTEQAPKEFESVTLGWVWFDEPPPQDIFVATVARARRGMIAFFTLTPLFHAAWIKDDLVDKRDGKFIDYITADVYDNSREQPGCRGILAEKDIERMIAVYPPDEIEARVHGKFGHLLGRVHKLFDRRIHCIDYFRINPDDYAVAMAIDTHPRVGDHVTYMAIDRKGTKFICDELVWEGETEELCGKLKKMEKAAGYRVVKRLLDPSGFAASRDKRRLNHKTIAEIFEDNGFDFEPGSKDLVGGIRRVDDALWYKEKLGHIVHAPEVYFMQDSVPVCIKQLDEYVWNDYKGKDKDEKKKMARPKDKNDHMPENIRRLIVAEVEFEENREVQKRFKAHKARMANRGKNRGKRGSKASRAVQY